MAANKVKVVALKYFLGEEGRVQKDDVLIVTPRRARELEGRGLGQIVREQKPTETKPTGPTETKPIAPTEVKNDGDGKQKKQEGGIIMKYRCKVDGCNESFETKEAMKQHITEAHPELLERRKQKMA